MAKTKKTIRKSVIDMTAKQCLKELGRTNSILFDKGWGNLHIEYDAKSGRTGKKCVKITAWDLENPIVDRNGRPIWNTWTTAYGIDLDTAMARLAVRIARLEIYYDNL